MTDVLILGAGFGGLELATVLTDEMSGEVRTTLIDQSDSFVFGFSKLEVMLGRQRLEDVSLRYADVSKTGLDIRREVVTSIEPTERRVTTDRGTYEPDILVVALGADYDHAATPGFVEGGFEFYSHRGAVRLSEALPAFRSGKLVLAILATPFKCPPAPYEGAFLLHDYFVERGVRGAIEMELITPMDSPIPVSKETSEVIVRSLAERTITYTPGAQVISLDPDAKRARMRDGREIDYDFFIGVPKHRAPDVVERSGLTAGGADGWIAVDQRNLRTPFDGVYALGDIADAPVPRAGVFAESAARVVARDIQARIRGTEPGAPYDGSGTCYLEMGGGLVAKVNVDILSGPEPAAAFIAPSEAFAREKEEFASTRRARWFGLA